MSEGRDLRHVGDRIEQLLGDVHSMISPPAWARVDELMRRVVALYGTALGRIVALLGENGDGNSDVRARLLQDDLLASLLLLHGLHPEDFGSRVRRALERVRPYLGSHGGGIELLGADAANGTVRLRMQGSCDGCPSSALTIKLAVESAIKEMAPEVTRIEVQGVTTPPPEPSHTPPMARPEVASTPNGRPATWVPLGEVPALTAGVLAACDLSGRRIVLCRIGEALYAYRNACAACGSALEHGGLDGNVLTCPGCGQRYDMHGAGRCLERRELHLEPLPLLQDGSAVRIAVREEAP